MEALGHPGRCRDCPRGYARHSGAQIQCCSSAHSSIFSSHELEATCRIRGLAACGHLTWRRAHSSLMGKTSDNRPSTAAESNASLPRAGTLLAGAFLNSHIFPQIEGHQESGGRVGPVRGPQGRVTPAKEEPLVGGGSWEAR